MNLPDNFNAAAFDARYGDRPERYASRDAHSMAALAELARRMGFDDCAELLDERVSEELAEYVIDGEERAELARDVAAEAARGSDAFLTSRLMVAIGDHRIAEAKRATSAAVRSVQAFVRAVAA